MKSHDICPSQWADLVTCPYLYFIIINPFAARNGHEKWADTPSFPNPSLITYSNASFPSMWAGYGSSWLCNQSVQSMSAKLYRMMTNCCHSFAHQCLTSLLIGKCSADCLVKKSPVVHVLLKCDFHSLTKLDLDFLFTLSQQIEVSQSFQNEVESQTFKPYAPFDTWALDTLLPEPFLENIMYNT